ncbi:hypothetical protein NN561_012593 [Cricetulus griseus]
MNTAWVSASADPETQLHGMPLPQPPRHPGLRSPRFRVRVPRPFRIPGPRAERPRWNLTRARLDPPWFWGSPGAGERPPRGCLI